MNISMLLPHLFSFSPSLLLAFHCPFSSLDSFFSILFFYVFCRRSVAEVIADVLSAILFVLLLSYSVTLAAFMVGLDLIESYGIAFYGLVTASLNILTQMVIYCAFSENMTYDLLITGDYVYESPWYQLPIRLQKLYVLPILRSQRLFRLTGLDIIECSLRVFASVRLLLIFLFFEFYKGNKLIINLPTLCS